MGDSADTQNKYLPAGFVVADRYKIETRLGSGGMGSVYLAHDLILNEERIAIKILHSDLTQNQRQTQRFLREVQLMRKVNHKNVVRTFDVGSDGNIVYFTMEYVEGKQLEEFIQNGDFPKARLEQLILEICAGLEAIHKAEIIHRDLKPANILIKGDGSLKITDFGVARPEYSDLTAHNEILGSALYIAPEIWLGTKLTTSVDLYSLGVLLYELTTGTLPFDGDSPAALMRMHLEFVPIPPKEVNDQIPTWLNKLILKLLEKSPLDRPKSAQEIIGIVQRHQGVQPTAQDGVSSLQQQEDTQTFLSKMEQNNTSNWVTNSPSRSKNVPLASKSHAPRRAPSQHNLPMHKSFSEAILARLICVIALITFFFAAIIGLEGILCLTAAKFTAILDITELLPSDSFQKFLLLCLLVISLAIKHAIFPTLMGAMTGSLSVLKQVLKIVFLSEFAIFALLTSVVLVRVGFSNFSPLLDLLYAGIWTAYYAISPILLFDPFYFSESSPSLINWNYISMLAIYVALIAVLTKIIIGKHNPKNANLAAIIVFTLIMAFHILLRALLIKENHFVLERQFEQLTNQHFIGFPPYVTNSIGMFSWLIVYTVIFVFSLNVTQKKR